MNKNIINTLLVGSAALALASCSENTWNEHFLKGFESGVDYENATSGAYTLTTEDYEAISKLMQDKAQTDAEKAEAKAIATNCYFNKNGNFPASVALPPFMETASFPYYLASNGSTADISYSEASDVPEVLSAISGATEYTVSSDDYKNAWGSDVDYIAAFAPMTPAAVKLPGILKNAIPDAAAGAYAIVRYNESETNPIFISNSEVEEFAGGTFFMVADGINGAGPVSGKTYGYLPLVEMQVSDGAVNASETNAFTFIPTDGGYYIKDVYGRFLYQKGTYNSFNFAYDLSSVQEEEGCAVWTVEVASNGQATITNIAVGKWIQYDGGYSSWGSYNEAKGTLPVLYKAPSPKFYLVTEDGHGAGPVAENKPYGYLASVDMTVENGAVVSADPTNAFTFEVTNGGFYIIDSYGRYLYQDETHTSFNVSEAIPEEGAVWTLSTDENGLVKILNVDRSKYIQYDNNYNSWGSYAEDKGAMPKMYNAALSAAAKPAARVVAGTPVTEGTNSVYYYDGSKWEAASGVIALDPADYAAMGVDNAKLTSPETMIPLYLKNKLIYAQDGDEMIVVYNYNKADLFVYDGAKWTLNNNGLENVVGKFSKSNNAWSFTKYVGKATFDLFNEDQLMLDRNYIFVAGNICGTVIPSSDTYGYINAYNVAIVDGTIVIPTDAYAYTFASSATVEDVKYSVPEGTFLMKDSNNRYLYMRGTYTSFNVQDNPTIEDGGISKSFLWTASKDADGNWTIKNVDNGKTWAYSTKYTSFGAYDSLSDVDVLPTLYMMRE
ncbi:MAG: hypothetical protein K2N48_10385 [Muribaculaceae bacterium]|nr:hypothetical protein [Muribaculaceae bacterium]